MFPWERYGDDYTDAYGKQDKADPKKDKPAKDKPAKSQKTKKNRKGRD